MDDIETRIFLQGLFCTHMWENWISIEVGIFPNRGSQHTNWVDFYEIVIFLVGGIEKPVFLGVCRSGGKTA